MEEEVLDLRELISMAKEHLRWLIFMPLLFALVGGLVSFFVISPTYEARTTLMVNKGKEAQQGLTMEDVNFGRQVIYTYAEIAKSNAVMEKVRRDMGLENGEPFNVEVAPLKDTQILNVKVQSTDPSFAFKAANSIASNFAKEVIRVAKVDNVQIVDYATLPISPIKPNKILNTLASALVGLFFVVGIIFLKEMLNATIRTEKDVEVHLGLNVIGKVPKYQIEGEVNNGKNTKSNR